MKPHYEITIFPETVTPLSVYQAVRDQLEKEARNLLSRAEFYERELTAAQVALKKVRLNLVLFK